MTHRAKKHKNSDLVTYGPQEAYHTYERPGVAIQIRCGKTAEKVFFNGGVVASMATMGGQFSTSQTPDEARKLARKIVRQLNTPRK